MLRGAWRRLYDLGLTWARPREPEPLPARFDRRRVYVLPTRFGLFYAALLLAMLRVALEPPAGSGSVLNLDQGHGEAGILLATERRGWLDLPRIRVSTTRPLGLARAWSYVWSQAPLLVYPRPEVDGPPLPSGSGDRVQSRVQPTGDDVHHLRGYRSGDSRRAIAWKPSARRDTLLVREYEQPLGADIVLDWRGAGQLPHEARISRLARWVDEAEREGRRYRLALPGVPALGPGPGAVHRHACLRALALMPHG